MNSTLDAHLHQVFLKTAGRFLSTPLKYQHQERAKTCKDPTVLQQHKLTHQFIE